MPEFNSISQNCSFDSISIIENSNSSSSQLNDQFNEQSFNSSSSTSSSSDIIYSPLQITPPETPPSSCDTNSSTSQTTLSRSKKGNSSSRSKKSKNEQPQQEINKKKRLLPLAPKPSEGVIKSISSVIQLNNSNNSITNANDLLNNLNNNNNSLNYNLNNQNLIKMPIQQQQSQLNDEKLSKEEISKIKEKARRARNRLSAMNSRQKKLEYVKGIEVRLEELDDENQNLKKENGNLKDLVSKLTFENDQLKSVQNKMQTMPNDYLNYSSLDQSSKQGFLLNSNDTTKAKKTISLLAVIFLIGLNMNLYNDNFKAYDSSKKLSNLKSTNDDVFKGRVLLWSDNNLSDFNTSTSANCSKQNFISRNETLILESKLRNWAIHQTSKQQPHLYSSSTNNHQKNFINLNDNQKGQKLPWYLHSIRNSWNQIDEQRKMFLMNELNYEQIINSVRPKDDTYYFVTLNTADHLILPLNFYSNRSLNSQNLLRPKFSLLLPALNSQFTANLTNSAKNQTKEFRNSNSFLHLIEIDFEVINMKPIQILKNHINQNNQSNQSNQNNRFKQRIVRNSFVDKFDKLQQQPQTNLTKPFKSILSKNQTNVQSQFKKAIMT